MSRTLAVLATPLPLCNRLVELVAPHFEGETKAIDCGGCDATARLDSASPTELVVVPRSAGHHSSIPDVEHATRLARRARELDATQCVLISSTAVFDPNPHHVGMAPERPLPAIRSHNPVARAWRDLESRFASAWEESGGDAALTILRVAPAAMPAPRDFFGRWLTASVATRVWGHSPSIQVLDERDLARAVGRALAAGRGGIYHVVPRSVIPAARIARGRRIPLPYTIQRISRALLSFTERVFSAHELDYLRYSTTASGAAAANALGFRPHYTSHDALALEAPAQGEEPDDFGFDPRFVDRLGRWVLEPLRRRYWRIDVRGLEHVPRTGPVVLVGVHRGFVPIDAIMTLHLLRRATGRTPRYLVHPGLLKFPVFADVISRLGGVIACHRNADRMLARNELLGVFPDGVHGAFTSLREAYRPGRFRRHDFVRMALRHQAPILPVAIVGAAEAFPVVAQVRWRRWRRFSEWPSLPITATLVPLPVPSRWRVRFLPPIEPRVGEGSPHAAIRTLGQHVRDRLQEAIGECLEERRSIFF